MRTDVDFQELPARLNEIIALANAGQEVVLTEHGTAKAKLVPLSNEAAKAPSEPRTLGLRPGAIILAPDFNDPLPDEFWMGEE